MTLGKDSGTTLLEVLMVAGVIGLLLTVLVSLTTTAITRNREAEKRTVATKLAQEGVEWVRAEKNEMGWVQFGVEAAGLVVGDTELICLDDPGKSFSSNNNKPFQVSCKRQNGNYDSNYAVDGIDENFYREIQLTRTEPAGGEPIYYELEVLVGWDGMEGDEVNLSSKLFEET